MKTAINGRHITWRELLACEVSPFTSDDQVYAIRDGAGTVIYVGRATDALGRLLSHIGEGAFSWATPPTAVGEYIRANLPAALDWQVTVYAASSAYEIAIIRHFNPYFNTHHKPAAQSLPPSPPLPKPSESSALHLDI